MATTPTADSDTEDGTSLRVTIDGAVVASRVPAGRSVGVVVEPGPHTLIAMPIAPTPPSAGTADTAEIAPVQVEAVEEAGAITGPEASLTPFEVDGQGLAIEVRADGVTISPKDHALSAPAEFSVPRELVQARSAGAAPVRFRQPPVTVASIAVALGLITTVTGMIVSQMAIGRSAVREERTRRMMQRAAQRSLEDLPPLTIGHTRRLEPARLGTAHAMAAARRVVDPGSAFESRDDLVEPALTGS